MSPNFDLAKIQELTGLFAVLQESRDEKWQLPYYPAVDDAVLYNHNPQILNGPDGFPYQCLWMCS